MSWTNTHGDRVALVNPDTGDVITGGGFDPFSSPLPDTTVSTTGFQGGYTDPVTGEVNAHARWYNPATATFTSRDTWQLAPSPLAQANRYLYANASPLNLLDPSGHAPSGWDWVAVGLFAPQIAVGLAGYGAGVAVSGCARGRCNTAAKTAGGKVGNVVQSFWNSNDKRTKNTSSKQTRNSANSSSSSYGNGGSARAGGGTGRSNGIGNNATDWNLPWIPWIPWIPGVPPPPAVPIPLRIDLTALLTLPIGTAQAAADKAPDEIDLLNHMLLKNGPGVARARFRR
ncbi:MULTISPECIES: RHS repeat-associated core domain-containing protein [unclassified Glycomyces]|uniref:RHS repeat-associated core domain-containing protein n=1 Tax=Glycomyces sp. NRRL B-16210 TaxID=1463821 RepID=UPI0009DD83FE